MTRFLLLWVSFACVVTPCSAESSDRILDQAADTIDSILESQWSDDGIEPADLSSDEEFHRRVWLDLAGIAPPVAATRRFLAETDQRKRIALIDNLLRSHRYANHMATRWNAILLPPDAFTQLQQRQNVDALHRWLSDQFYNNRPYDHLVGSFLTAGGAGNSGPAIFYTSHSVQPEKVAAATSRIFLGLQLQCAECHDHPFDRWTQKDFWQFAAFFSQLQQNEPRPGSDAFIEDRPGREVHFPDSNQVMSPRYPGIGQPPEKDPGDIRRRQLTIWLASRDNPYFARAAANRAWAHLFGRGIVDPVDAMDATHPPSNPQLLDFLANHLIELRFDLRRFYSTLARTQAYGRTSSLPSSPRPPQDSFAAMSIKTLTAEQYYDSLRQNVFCRLVPTENNSPMGLDAEREAFVSRMRSLGTSPEEYPHGVVQALGLMNGPEITAASRGRIGLLTALDAPFFDSQQKIETLYLAVLSRYPTDREYERVESLLSKESSEEGRAQLLEDLLWVLLNTAECAVCP